MKKTLTDLRHFLRFILTRFNQDHCAETAASLTFTTLLSLVPLITIALTLTSAFPVFADFSGQIKSYLLGNMPSETGARIISQYMEQFAESAAKLTAVGIVFLAFTAMLMMLTIDNAFNKIWRVSRRRTWVLSILTYWAVLTLAPVLVGGSLSLTSWLVGVSTGHARQVPAFGMVMLKVVPVLLTATAFTLLFRVVPNRFVPMRHAIIGGVVAAVAFEYMNRTFAFYIANFTTYQLVYGAFASIPIFLLYIYLSWLTVLLGAVIAASLSHWRGGSIKSLLAPTQLYYALRILKTMSEGMRSGTVVSLPMLSRQLRIGFDPLEQILEKLEQINIVRKLSQSGWSLIRDVAYVQAGELFRLFVFDPASLPAPQDETETSTWVTNLVNHYSDMNEISLADLFGKIGGSSASAP